MIHHWLQPKDAYWMKIWQNYLNASYISLARIHWFISFRVYQFCYRLIHRPLTRYVILWVAHAPGMPGTFSPSPTSKETASKRARHASHHARHARAVMHVGLANPAAGKRSRHSRGMCNPQFYVSGKRLMQSALGMDKWLQLYSCDVIKPPLSLGMDK